MFAQLASNSSRPRKNSKPTQEPPIERSKRPNPDFHRGDPTSILLEHPRSRICNRVKSNELVSLQPRSAVKDSYENFSIYGFSLDYPEECRVEFNAKSRRESGDVVFHFADKADRVRIFLSWGELEKVSKRFQTTEEHAEFSLDAMKKGKNVKNFERVSRDTLSLHSHRGSVNKVKFDERSVGLTGSKNIPREAYSLHVHCTESNRYFVLYTMTPRSVETRYDRIMDSMTSSFRCH